jgi:hypothetical protein
MSEKKEEERQTATGYIMQEEHIAYSRHHLLSQIQTIFICHIKYVKDFEWYYQKDYLHTKGIICFFFSATLKVLFSVMDPAESNFIQ